MSGRGRHRSIANRTRHFTVWLIVVPLTFTACRSGSPSPSADRTASTDAIAARPTIGDDPPSVASGPSAPSAPSAPIAPSAPSAPSVAPDVESSFPVAISADHQVVDSAGRPWLVVGDGGWSSIVALTGDEQDAYLHRLDDLGYNAVLVNVIENAFSNDPPLDVNGQSPFTGELFQSPPNKSYWASVDRYLEQSAQHGITFFMCVAYLGFAENNGVAAELGDADDADAFAYGAFLGERYGSAPNIVWVLGGDRTDVSPELLARVDAIARGIRSVDPLHLMTAHASDGVLGSDVYGEYPWFDIDTVYDIVGNTVADTHRALLTKPSRPVMSIEGLYENDRENPLQAGDPYLRYQAWAALMAGAFGHVYGNTPRWHFGMDHPYNPAPGTWQQSLDDPESDRDQSTIEQGMLARFSEMWEWSSTTPDLEGRFILGSDGDQDAVGRYRAGLGMVYVPDRTRADIDLSVVGTSTKVTRFDPVSGASEPIDIAGATGVFSVGADGSNAAGDGDWVYVVTGS